MGDGERVLIVDNDAQVRHCLEYAFDSYGYVVRTCSDGHEALNLCRRKPFDYIVTDDEIPGMNGLELVRRLRVFLPRAIFIGMSCADRGVAFQLAGAHDFRKKPVVPYEIAMMINGADLGDEVVYE